MGTYILYDASVLGTTLRSLARLLATVKHDRSSSMPPSLKKKHTARSKSGNTAAIRSVDPIASLSRDQVQRTALLSSVTGASFEDVKFFAFSRRTRAGAVDSPRALFANSALVRKASSHFDFGASPCSY